LNEAFIIDGTKKDELIAANTKSAEIIRPILRGRDIKRYGFEYADLWIINTHKGIKSKNIPPVNIEDYPAIKAHLDNYYEKISNRLDKGDTPYNLRNCIYTDDFNHQKIIWGEISDKHKFTLDKKGIYYLSNKAFLLTGEHLHYLLAFLNSKLCEYFFSQIATTTGVGTVQWLKYKVETLPIPNVENHIEQKFIDIVNKIVDSQIDEKLDNEINDMIYDILSLTAKEKEYISNYVSKSSICDISTSDKP